MNNNLTFRKVIDHQGLAAWVQAIGSLAALGIAIYVSDRQSKQAVKTQRLRNLKQARAHISGAFGSAMESAMSLRSWASAPAAAQPVDVGIYRFETAIQMLETVAAGQTDYQEIRLLLDIRTAIDRIRLLALELRYSGTVNAQHVEIACDGLTNEFKKSGKWLDDKERLLKADDLDV